MPNQEQPNISDRARQELGAKDIDVAALAGLPMVEIAQAFARSDIPVAPAHYRPEDRLCSCGDLGCPVPGAHLVRRHLFSDPWELRSLDANDIDRSWRSHPQASVGFRLKLAGDTYERRLTYDGAAILECIEFVQIR